MNNLHYTYIYYISLSTRLDLLVLMPLLLVNYTLGILHNIRIIRTQLSSGVSQCSYPAGIYGHLLMRLNPYWTLKFHGVKDFWAIKSLRLRRLGFPKYMGWVCHTLRPPSLSKMAITLSIFNGEVVSV